MARNTGKSRVLIIADPEGRRQVALGRGFMLAERLGRKAHVVGFCHESLAALEGANKALAAKARKSVIRLRKESLKAQIEAHDTSGIKVTNEVVWSKRIHEWVEDECKQQPPEVIVKTGHRTETFMYTPTDWHLIRDCATPTLIVAEKKWRKTRPVMAAVDLTTRSRSKQQLNKEVIKAASQYAQAMDCPLYLLHAIHISPVLSELDMIDEYSHEKEIRAKLARRVEKMCSDLDIPNDNVLLKRGPADKVIVTESARLKAQLLVVGTIGRRGARAKLLGNTAEKVLMLARTDLLVIKP